MLRGMVKQADIDYEPALTAKKKAETTSGAASFPTAAGPPPKKQKTVRTYNLNDKEFDGVAFATELIAPHRKVPLDDISILHHLDFITSNSIRMANIGAALSRVIQESPVHATRAFMEDAKSGYDRIKTLKDELDAKVAELELDVEKEKDRATVAEAAANLSEEDAKKYKQSYTWTYGELLEAKERLQSAQDDYAELQGHMVSNMTEMYENLKEQVRVLAPELDFFLLSMHNVVEDGKIVPVPDDEDEDPPLVPPPKASSASTTAAPSGEVVPPEPEPDVEILNGLDGVVNATPISTMPPSPKGAAADATLDP
ncbi:uncharacterized protein LOC107647034 [Arachis ipaensis]|uniref:uncharacterized protein LOC107647034 n=1 Tax=Arachis ipaensis TaxID=130454 RepID=UPI0007AEEE7A|nr:uncharacterized protein LOC107647034 [Arachis ipaensis]